MIQILVSVPDGRAAPVPADDRGLAYGDGLFETIRVTQGKPELVERHSQRMLVGAGRLGIPLSPNDISQALRQAQGLVDRHPKARQATLVIKLLLTRGSGGRGYRPPHHPEPRLIVSLSEAPAMPPEQGVAVSISDVPVLVNPALAGIKTLNRLEQVLASSRMPEDCYEALMVSAEGDLVEGTRTALLFRWQNQWLTPPRDRVAVDSVMLAHVAHQLKQSGQEPGEAPLTPELCRDPGFGGLLLLNSIMGAVPVRTLDGERLPRSRELATIVSLANQAREFR